jgi:L-lactate utilization protein LutB
VALSGHSGTAGAALPSQPCGACHTHTRVQYTPPHYSLQRCYSVPWAQNDAPPVCARSAPCTDPLACRGCRETTRDPPHSLHSPAVLVRCRTRRASHVALRQRQRVPQRVAAARQGLAARTPHVSRMVSRIPPLQSHRNRNGERGLTGESESLEWRERGERERGRERERERERESEREREREREPRGATGACGRVPVCSPRCAGR